MEHALVIVYALVAIDAWGRMFREWGTTGSNKLGNVFSSILSRIFILAIVTTAASVFALWGKWSGVALPKHTLTILTITTIIMGVVAVARALTSFFEENRSWAAVLLWASLVAIMATLSYELNREVKQDQPTPVWEVVLHIHVIYLTFFGIVRSFVEKSKARTSDE